MLKFFLSLFLVLASFSILSSQAQRFRLDQMPITVEEGVLTDIPELQTFMQNVLDGGLGDLDLLDSVRVTADSLYLYKKPPAENLVTSMELFLTRSDFIDSLVTIRNEIENATDADGDPTNELQDTSNIPGLLEFVQGNSSNLDSAAIDGMGFITNPDDADSNPSNELQNISLSGDTATLDQGGGFIKLLDIPFNANRVIERVFLPGINIGALTIGEIFEYMFISPPSLSLSSETTTYYEVGDSIRIDLTNTTTNTGGYTLSNGEWLFNDSTVQTFGANTSDDLDIDWYPIYDNPSTINADTLTIKTKQTYVAGTLTDSVYSTQDLHIASYPILYGASDLHMLFYNPYDSLTAKKNNYPATGSFTMPITATNEYINIASTFKFSSIRDQHNSEVLQNFDLFEDPITDFDTDMAIAGSPDKLFVSGRDDSTRVLVMDTTGQGIEYLDLSGNGILIRGMEVVGDSLFYSTRTNDFSSWSTIAFCGLDGSDQTEIYTTTSTVTHLQYNNGVVYWPSPSNGYSKVNMDGTGYVASLGGASDIYTDMKVDFENNHVYYKTTGSPVEIRRANFDDGSNDTLLVSIASLNVIFKADFVNDKLYTFRINNDLTQYDLDGSNATVLGDLTGVNSNVSASTLVNHPNIFMLNSQDIYKTAISTYDPQSVFTNGQIYSSSTSGLYNNYSKTYYLYKYKWKTTSNSTWTFTIE